MLHSLVHFSQLRFVELREPAHIVRLVDRTRSLPAAIDKRLNRRSGRPRWHRHDFRPTMMSTAAPSGVEGRR